MHPKSAIRWYKHWLAFKMLPCDTPLHWKLNYKEKYKAWTKTELKKLKQVIDTCPVLYLDELVTKMKKQLPKKKLQ